MNKEMLKGIIDILILSVLKQGDNYGYDISRIIKTRTESLFEIIEATLYLSLKRLEAQEAIEFYWGVESSGGKRKYYRITNLGSDLLKRSIKDWKEITHIVEKFV